MSKKNRNINSQLKHAVMCCFKENMDKHSYKIENGHAMDHHVWSYEYRTSLLDMTTTFSNFIQDKGYEVKKVKDITSKMVEEFLSEKAKTCTQNTINNYHHRLNKIAECANRCYKSDLNFKEIDRPQAQRLCDNTRGSGHIMPRNTLERVRSYAEANKSQSGYIVEVGARFGCRVAEATYLTRDRIDFEKGTISFKNTKNGKVYSRKLSQDDKRLLKEIIDNKYSNSERLFTVKDESVDKYLSDVQKKIGERELYSYHDMRRACAQKVYDDLRTSGVDMKTAMQKTNLYLNHSADRSNLLEKNYIKIW